MRENTLWRGECAVEGSVVSHGPFPPHASDILNFLSLYPTCPPSPLNCHRCHHPCLAHFWHLHLRICTHPPGLSLDALPLTSLRYGQVEELSCPAYVLPEPSLPCSPQSLLLVLLVQLATSPTEKASSLGFRDHMVRGDDNTASPNL